MTIDIEDEEFLARTEALIGGLVRIVMNNADMPPQVLEYLNSAYEEVGGSLDFAVHPYSAIYLAYELAKDIGHDGVTGYLGQALAEIDKPGSGAGEE